MDMDAFSKVNVDKIMKNGHFRYDDETIVYALSQQKTNNETVQEFVDNSIVLNNMEIFSQENKKNSKQKSKKMAFDNGIMKIKEKQSKQENIIYPFNNEYQA